jgi:hypothetical protein
MSTANVSLSVTHGGVNRSPQFTITLGDENFNYRSQDATVSWVALDLGDVATCTGVLIINGSAEDVDIYLGSGTAEVEITLGAGQATFLTNPPNTPQISSAAGPVSISFWVFD